MPFVEWEERYLLGVEQFDAHHKHLVDLLNRAYEMFVLNEIADEKLQEILDALTEYASYHFDQEESWMCEVNYPKQIEHMLEHKRFIYKLHELNKQLKDDKSALSLEIVSFLRRWLLEHILSADAKYAVFIGTSASR
jgi:hemerythrin